MASLDTIKIFYYSHENYFVDDTGQVIYDIFSLIKPQDLCLFRHDPGYIFNKRNSSTQFVEIITIPD